jgi:hypothetical protein
MTPKPATAPPSPPPPTIHVSERAFGPSEAILFGYPFTGQGDKRTEGADVTDGFLGGKGGITELIIA